MKLVLFHLTFTYLWGALWAAMNKSIDDGKWNTAVVLLAGFGWPLYAIRRIIRDALRLAKYGSGLEYPATCSGGLAEDAYFYCDATGKSFCIWHWMESECAALHKRGCATRIKAQ